MAKQAPAIVGAAGGIKRPVLPDSDPLRLTFGPSISPQVPHFCISMTSCLAAPVSSQMLAAPDTSARGCKQPSLPGPALHDKSRVHPRNFHNLHLNICLEHHGMGAKEEMQFFFLACLGRTENEKPFQLSAIARLTGQLCFKVSVREKKKDPSTTHRSVIKEGHSWHLHNYKSQPLRGPDV